MDRRDLREVAASMRPPEFTGGNDGASGSHRLPVPMASMRPPEFTGGNARIGGTLRYATAVASMRPPEFTGGNRAVVGRRAQHQRASMRPPEFTGGNGSPAERARGAGRRFNEAAGIHRRKRGRCEGTQMIRVALQ